MRTEIRIGGFGGQGVILAGIILGKAASIFDNNEAVQTQSYGPEARGGASKCEVVVSDGEIDYPKVQNPDILVAMSNEALIKYIVDLKDEGTLIVDPGTTDIEDVREFIDQHNIKVYEAPATKTANDEIGLKIVVGEFANAQKDEFTDNLERISVEKSGKKTLINSAYSTEL